MRPTVFLTSPRRRRKSERFPDVKVHAADAQKERRDSAPIASASMRIRC